MARGCGCRGAPAQERQEQGVGRRRLAEGHPLAAAHGVGQGGQERIGRLAALGHQGERRARPAHRRLECGTDQARRRPGGRLVGDLVDDAAAGCDLVGRQHGGDPQVIELLARR